MLKPYQLKKQNVQYHKYIQQIYIQIKMLPDDKYQPLIQSNFPSQQ